MNEVPKVFVDFVILSPRFGKGFGEYEKGKRGITFEKDSTMGYGYIVVLKNIH